MRKSSFQHDLADRLKNLRSYLPGAITNSGGFRLLQNWIFQGMVLMYWKEFLFRICLELVTISIVYFALVHLLTNDQSALILSVAVSHSLMWTLNGHLWALHITGDRRLIINQPCKIVEYLHGLESRLSTFETIEGCVVLGSLARGKFGSGSDLDVELVSKPGFFNSISAYCAGIRERSIAFFCKIPLELYFYENIHPSVEEKKVPLIIKDESGDIAKMLPQGKPISDYPFEDSIFFRDKVNR